MLKGMILRPGLGRAFLFGADRLSFLEADAQNKNESERSE